MSPSGASYPGGPRRRDQEASSSEAAPGARLGRAEEMEDRLHRRHRDAVRRRRKKRLALGFGVVLVVAGTAGFWMGYQANRTSEEIAAEESRAAQDEFDLTRERNVILQQLWLMEDLERAGQQP